MATMTIARNWNLMRFIIIRFCLSCISFCRSPPDSMSA